jgi:hypothetical protein
VLDIAGVPIPGVYAAGELVGGIYISTIQEQQV